MAEASTDPRSGFKAAILRVFEGYDDPSNRKPCATCEATGTLFTKSGCPVDCANCQGDGYNWIRTPFDGMFGATAEGVRR